MNQNYPPLFNGVKTIAAGFKIFTVALLLSASLSMNAQCPPGAQCDFLRMTSTLTSSNGAEISAFDPSSKKVFTVAGPVIEWHTMSNAGVLSFGASLPLGFTVPSGQIAIP